MNRILSLTDVFNLFVFCSLIAAEFDSDFQNSDWFPVHKYVTNKKYRPIYHITAPEGWLSSPTGFTYFKHQYHLFYQYQHYNGAWGHMSWGHAVSDNLIDWVYFPAALLPKDYYDRHGCLAGSAFPDRGFLILFYTGHVTSDNESFQTQNIAISEDGVLFRKYIHNPVIRQSPGGIGEFRNPKVWSFHHVWHMIVGSTSRERFGELELYVSTDMFEWSFNGTIVKSYGDMGFMWENPDIFEIEGNHVLLLSVQGIEADGYRFRNLYQTGYIIGTFNYVRRRFEDLEVSVATFHQLDYGHDFYGAKTTRAFDGRRLLIAWLGMWQSDFSESSAGWASMLTLIRELRLSKTGRLLMTPINEIVDLRVEILEKAWYNPGEVFKAGSKYFELLVNTTTVALDVALILEWKSGGRFTISYSAEHDYINIDRGGFDGVRRAYWSPVDHVYLRIFVDSSSIEIFCGEGEVVFSSRIYPKSINIKIGGKAPVHIFQYRLRRGISYDDKLAKQFNMHN